MGDRAVITASKSKTTGVGIYIHWGGDPEVVQTFLDEARDLGYRDPATHESYAMAKLCGLICARTGIESDSGVGIGQLKELDCDNHDNGVYVIGKDWKIVSRWGSGSDSK